MKLRIALPLVLLLSGCVHAQLSNQTYRTLTLTRDTTPNHGAPAVGSAQELRVYNPSSALRASLGITAGDQANMTLWSTGGSLVSLSSEISETMVIGRNNSAVAKFQLGIGSSNYGILSLFGVTGSSAILSTVSDIASLTLNSGGGSIVTTTSSSSNGIQLNGSGGSITIKASDSGTSQQFIQGTGSAIDMFGLGDITPFSSGTRDVGSTGLRWRDGWFGRNLTAGGDLAVTGDIDIGTVTMTISGGDLHINGGFEANGGVAATGGAADAEIFAGIPFASNAGLYVGGTQVVSQQQSGVGGTADGTYDSVEQGMINDMCEAMAAHGLIASCH